eukprot:Gregarina_sp_Poly_1__5666@NODE_2990_length_1474_cov_5_464819_g1891_i0_p3_GENE_NODE_2990_length_1474_cov_5_464819_g1891_i0NODE_2990_length_1474_cov_5_464819_g1891_i0_p3_ORF_typecomplete_len100_score7_69_NODE_2990_length_1474_cov_5_464819_g1891_i0367666
MVDSSGTWACGESDLFRDLAAFILNNGSPGGYLNYFNDQGFVASTSLPPSELTEYLVFSLTSEDWKLKNSWDLDLSLGHLLFVPRDLPEWHTIWPKLCS